MISLEMSMTQIIERQYGINDRGLGSPVEVFAMNVHTTLRFEGRSILFSISIIFFHN